MPLNISTQSVKRNSNSNGAEATSTASAAATALQHVEQACALADWVPPTGFATVPDHLGSLCLSPELVFAVGSATNNRRFFYFESLYDEFVARGNDDARVLKAFIKALCFRRCKAVEVVQSLLLKMFAHPSLDGEDWEDLSSLVADFGSAQLMDAILTRTAGKLQRPGFYAHAIRGCTEAQTPPNIHAALAVMEEMSRTGAPWSSGSLFHLLGGFIRLPHIPFGPMILLLKQYRSLLPPTATIEMPIAARVLGACERALSSEDVAKATELVNLLTLQERFQCLSMITEPREFRKPPPSEDCVYNLIEPFSVDLTALRGEDGVEKKAYYLFLFSSLRSLCEKAQLHLDTHPIHVTKIAPLRQLFRDFPGQFVVVPLEVELHIRSACCCPGQQQQQQGAVGPSSPSVSTCDTGDHSQSNPHHSPSNHCAATRESEGSSGGNGDGPQQKAQQQLPSNGGVAQLVLFAQCATQLHCPIGRALRVLSANPSIIRELAPLMSKYPSSWFSICDKICSGGCAGGASKSPTTVSASGSHIHQFHGS